MRPVSPSSLGAPILEEEAVSFAGFGPRSRRTGTLCLFEESLVFSPADGSAPTAIPLGQISCLGASVHRVGMPPGQPVLRVTYLGNLVYGVGVDRPGTWINAIEALERHRGGRRPRVEGRGEARRPDPRTFRWLAGMFLAVVLVMSVIVPLFLSFIQARQNEPAPRPPIEDRRAEGA
jgi:hypothetical protein